MRKKKPKHPQMKYESGHFYTVCVPGAPDLAVAVTGPVFNHLLAKCGDAEIRFNPFAPDSEFDAVCITFTLERFSKKSREKVKRFVIGIDVDWDNVHDRKHLSSLAHEVMHALSRYIESRFLVNPFAHEAGQEMLAQYYDEFFSTALFCFENEIALELKKKRPKR